MIIAGTPDKRHGGFLVAGTMIARFLVYIPSALYIQPSSDYRVWEIQREGYRIKVYPPQQSSRDLSHLTVTSDLTEHEITEGLMPTDPPQPASGVGIDGGLAIKGNVIKIEVIADHFERPAGHPPCDKIDPPLKLLFSIVNDLLSRIRALTRGHEIKPVHEKSTHWRIDYVADDGSPLPVEEGKVLRRSGSFLKETIVAVKPSMWEHVCGLPPEFTACTWDMLLMDAEALLPDVGAAIAVVNAALEAFIPWALDEIQRHTKFANTDLWHYTFNREDWYQNPSVIDQFGIFLKMMTGRDLKEEEKRLWEKLQNLRTARNSFSHDGKPLIGGKEVSAEKAAALVDAAKAIITWVETLLPEQTRRPEHREMLTINTRRRTAFVPLAPPVETEEST